MTAHSVGDSDHKEIKSENELPLETLSGWSEEHDCVPLKQRLKMLLAKGVSKGHEKNLIPVIPPVDMLIKTEDDHCDSLGFYSDHNKGEARSNSASSEHIQRDMVQAIVSSSLQEVMLSQRLEVEHTDAKNNPANHLGSFQDVSFSAHVQGVPANIGIPEDIFDDLDHIVLKERQRMLLSRKLVGSIKPAMEHNVSNSSTTVDNMILQNAGIGKGGSNLYGNRSGIERNGICENRDENVFEFCQHQGPTLTESGNSNDVCREARAFSSSRSDNNEKCNTKIVPTSVLPSFANVKVELLDNDLENPNKGAIGHPYLNKIVPVKSELVNSAEILEDIIDHMFLGERIKLLAREFPKTILHENFENSKKFAPSGLDCRPSLFESSEPLKVKRPRKRRKTITDSVETALEEDAPGLLQVLVERGILVDEIKLYGETEVDESLDESSIEESFSELEDVITKIFSQRPSLLKLAPIRCSKGEKASYCLACLISLVEQARYLQFRKWPIEWGWCRDLQSFIFVFERHNRIVLERPEYGYATYFFELVDTSPVHWQIKRLVTAMKLTSCSRITLIENRALMVGDDLTEGEARVLMEYGWVPDSGLGTMLNYRDRVVHDRRHESSDTSEWRSKIGKLLMDGYNGGIIVPNEIPNNLMEYGVVDSPQVKLEH